jgi:hypothetical protein
MMKIIFAFLLWSIGADVAWASPFLVCDPYPAGLDQNTSPVSFILKGLSANPISTPVQTNQDGTIQLHYDLSTLGNGTYTVIADAVNVFGGVSPDSAPFRVHKRRTGLAQQLTNRTVTVGSFVFTESN